MEMTKAKLISPTHTAKREAKEGVADSDFGGRAWKCSVEIGGVGDVLRCWVVAAMVWGW